MNRPRPCPDWTTLPLEPGGRGLVEASAGTGKTWTISVLYLRLLLEQGLAPTQVVVTTFTEAAAADLRERLRGRLLWALAQAGPAVPASDPASGRDAEWLRARWQDSGAVRRDRLRLERALADLDLAPIGTLHSLCRRVLLDHPFQCGSGFGAAPLIDGSVLDEALIDDLWRELAQSPDPLPPGAEAWYAAGRSGLTGALQQALRPGVRVRVVWAAERDALFDAAWAQRLRQWAATLRLAGRKSALRNAIVAVAAFIEAADPDACLKQSTRENLAAAPADQLADAEAEADFLASEEFAFCRRAAAMFAAPRLPERSAALAEFTTRLRERRATHLAERGQLSFDALIERVHGALHGAGGEPLADRLHQAWPAALVDEFQDTDALQYAILDRIYRDRAGAPRGRLVMIGDPKQAIYGFRGGGIHAYLRARGSADSALHLSTNFRSASRLIAAVNGLFGLAGPALGQHHAAIRYETVQPAPAADTGPYTVAGKICPAPLRLHLDPAPPRTKGERVAAALAACANVIATLIGDPAQRIEGRPLGPGDFAVLVPRNEHILALRRELSRRGVPCVGAGRSSVFATDIACELQLLLHGVHHLDDPGAVRAALTTRLYGLDFDALRALEEDAEAWHRHLELLGRWRQRWQHEGVLAAVRPAIAHAAPGLLAGDRGAGERAVTDLRHLGELLQARAAGLSGPGQLLAWMQRQRRGDDEEDSEAAEELQLRLESDAHRVRLLTLHASKGLEFPIVLLPLMWAHEAQSGRPGRVVRVHEEVAGGYLIDVGGPAHAEARRAADVEDQDERFRVLYVALTRARHACHVFGLPPGRGRDGTSDRPPEDPQRSALDALLERALAAGGEAALAALPGVEWIHAPWPQAQARHVAAVEDATPRLAARREPPARPPEFRYSFSALTRSRPAAATEEAPADDEAGIETVEDTTAAVSDPGLLALEAVRGTRFGNALHAVLERRQIGLPLAAQTALLIQALTEHDLGDATLPRGPLAERLAERLDAALAAELLPGLRLGDLDARDQRAEMGFYFPLDAVSLPALRAACARHGEPDLVPPGGPLRLQGMMTGKIDLTFQHSGRFHVLDYKGNWLGPALDDYRGDALRRAMDAHHYRFQALLYTIAVDRFVRQRVAGYQRSRQLGAGIYLFVRAAGLAPGAGVYAERFDDALIEAVDRVLAGEGGG